MGGTQAYVYKMLRSVDLVAVCATSEDRLIFFCDIRGKEKMTVANPNVVPVYISPDNSDDDSFAGIRNDEQIQEVLDPPKVIAADETFDPSDRLLCGYAVRLVELGSDPIDRLLSHMQAHDPSLRDGSVGICCRFCAMPTAPAPIAPDAVIFPKDFSIEELGDRIETQLKEHVKHCRNVPDQIAHAFDAIEDGDTPNNVWRASLEGHGIISVDHVEEVENNEYLEFRALIFNPEIYGWSIED